MKNWEKAEKKDRELFGTTKQRGSGNQDHYPTDSTNSRIVVETKYTQKQSYSISKQTWNKLCEETAVLDAKESLNRIPVLSLHIDGVHLIVLSSSDFDSLIPHDL